MKPALSTPVKLVVTSIPVLRPDALARSTTSANSRQFAYAMSGISSRPAQYSDPSERTRRIASNGDPPSPGSDSSSARSDLGLPPNRTAANSPVATGGVDSAAISANALSVRHRPTPRRVASALRPGRLRPDMSASANNAWIRSTNESSGTTTGSGTRPCSSSNARYCSASSDVQASPGRCGIT